MEKIYIFGAGNTGVSAYKMLKNTYDVCGFLDNDSNKWNTELCGCMVYSPKDIEDQSFQVVIASVYYISISKQLKELGFTNVYIFWGEYITSDKMGYNHFYLSEVPQHSLFSNCVYDEELVSQIKKDFSLNYPKVQVRCDVNKKKSMKRVLVCAFLFPPIGGGGVQRTLKFVKNLRKFGYEPVVLTSGESWIIGERNDYSLLEELDNDIQVIRVDFTTVPSMLSDAEQQEIYNLYSGVMRSVDWMNRYMDFMRDRGFDCFLPDIHICWINNCLKQIETRIDLRTIDVVFTTGNPFSDFFLGYYLKNKYGVKWVVDYRDSWTAHEEFFYKAWNVSCGNTRNYELEKELEKALVSEADFIVMVSKYVMDIFPSQYSVPKERIMELTNGYDEMDFYDLPSGLDEHSKFTLCYNGKLYLETNPTVIFMAINELIAEGKIDADKIQLIHNGDTYNDYRSLISELDLYGVLVENGYLKHSESIAISMDSDLLIVLVGTGEYGKRMYTGKVFEYLRMRKPILAIASLGGVLDDLLKKTKSGKVFTNEEKDEIKQYIYYYYKEWEKGKVLKVGDEDVVKEYSRENLTKKLAGIFDQLVCEEDL